MKTYFKQIRISQIITLLNFFLLLFFLTLIVVLSLAFYNSLPEDSEIRSKYKLGMWLTKFEIGHILYGYAKLEIPVYELQISEKDYSKLVENLPKDSIMTDEYQDYVPAKFIYKGEEYKVKVRFHGLTANHWSDEKKSWRINFKKENLFNGKKGIHLIIPQDRAYISEHLSNYIAKKMGLLVPDSQFVFLKINGQLEGVYFEVEHPGGSAFLERHGRVGNANFYNEEDWNWLKYGFTPLYSKIGHWKKKAEDSVSLFDNYAEIDYLLFLLNQSNDEQFYREIESLLDINNFLRWQSHSMLMGSYHQGDHNNMNLYFDITKGKFEVMPWDVNHWLLTEQFFDKSYNPLVTRILRNPQLLHLRNTILWNYINDEKNLKDDLAFYDDTYKKIRKAFYVDRKKGFLNWKFENDIRRNREIIISNRSKIRDNINFSKLFATIRINSKKSELKEKNIIAMLDMTIHGFSASMIKEINLAADMDKLQTDNPLYLYYDSNNNNFYDNRDEVIAQFSYDAPTKKYKASDIDRTLYPSRDENLKPSFKTYRFFIVSNSKIGMDKPIEIKLSAINAVTKTPIEPEIRYIDERTFARFSEISESPDYFAHRYPYFKRDRISLNHFIIPAGEVVVTDTVIVPKGVSITIAPGAILKFGQKVSFISYGKVQAVGTLQSPIIFTSINKNQPWGVFAVTGEKANNSRFEYVTVEYGSDDYVNGIFFIGALDAYHASVEIRNSIFRYNNGDDAINIKNAEAGVYNSRFYKNSSDAIDFDYTNGRIEGNYFTDNGGDSIDLGTASPHIIGNYIERSKDKGISVGEASSPKIVNNLIRLCDIGIATKDASGPVIINNTIVENNFGIKGYMKKTIFGGSKGTIQNTLIWGNKESISLDKISELSITDSLIQGRYKGENIFDLKPDFIDSEKGNYMLAQTESNSKILKGGNTDGLKEIFHEYNNTVTPIGILSLPEPLIQGSK